MSDGEHGWMDVNCKACGAEVTEDSPKAAIEAWNTRTPPPATWSKTPPADPGWYWVLTPLGGLTGPVPLLIDQQVAKEHLQERLVIGTVRQYGPKITPPAPPEGE
jgi:hypothetical protein